MVVNSELLRDIELRRIIKELGEHQIAFTCPTMPEILSQLDDEEGAAFEDWLESLVNMFPQ